jgi:hypothetical protein
VREIGFSDPPPQADLTGAWSSYVYNGLIYESEITVGMNLFRYGGRELRGARHLRFLTPQTQQFTLDGGDDDDGGGDDD